MADSLDASNDYLAHREQLALNSGVEDAIERAMRNQKAVPIPYRETPLPQERQLDPFPTDRRPPEDQSTVGSIMRNVAEIPKQAISGVESAMQNAVGWAIDPLANWLNENVADLSYTREAPKTTTGAVTKSVTEFLTGFVPALKGLRAAGMTGKVLAPNAAAMIADFTTKDPHEKRLSNFWQEAGLPDNVLTEYLAAKPEDGAVEGRFKSAVESVLTGAAAEGVVLGARALKASKIVAGSRRAEESILKERYGEVTPESFSKVIGDPSKPMIETVVKAPPASLGKMRAGVKATAETIPEDVVAGRATVEAGDEQVYINFARIDGPDEIKALIGDMATRFSGKIDDATRGTMTQAETSALADDLGMTVPDLLARRRGQPLNAEEALAARRLWAASGEKLLEAAKKAADPNAGPVDQFTFRKMMATHYAIQAEVIGARTETARALASWRIPAGGSIEKARAIEQVMQAMGGPDASAQMARRLAILAETGATPQAIAKFAEKGAGATTLDAVREVWVNGLLSSPATHVVNTTSNMMVAFQQIYERGAAAQIGQLRGSDGVALGEATMMAYGLVTGVKDAFRLAWKALKTGETGAALNKVDLPSQKAVTAELFGMASDTGLGRTVDFLANWSPVGGRLPSRLLGTQDEFFKAIGYRMELHAQALRQATGEGLSGEALGKRIAQLVTDTPENLRIAAADQALYQTFTSQPGVIGEGVLRLREKIPAISFVLPFVKTPVNIARYAFERSPLAPLVGQWRADVAAGGARADLALAKMATGSSIMLMAMDWADSGAISGRGPKEAGEREAMTRQGWQPYSVKVGDKWFSYNRTDPFGMTMGFAADIASAVRNGELDEDDVDEWTEVTAAAIATISQVTINKTYLSGLSEFAEMMSDPTRYSGSYISNFVASFVPATSLMGAIERAGDPTVRETNTPWDVVQSKILGLSENLTPRRNLWGDEIKTESGMGKGYDFISPVAARTINPEPIDAEIMRIGEGPQRIAKKAFFDGVQVNFKEHPKAYDEYVRLAGNDLQHPAWGMGAKDFLNAVVSGNHSMSTVYNMRSDEMKAEFISQTISQYRKLAAQAVMADPQFSDFAQYVQLLKEDSMQQRMPQVQ